MPKVVWAARLGFPGRAVFRTTARPTIPLGSRMRFANLRSAATLLLPFDGLPATDQL
jgi:hypothetical protein